MSIYSIGANAIERELKRVEGLTAAAQALRELGNLEANTTELARKKEMLERELEGLRTALVNAEARHKQAEQDTAAMVADRVAEADHRADGIVAEATRMADEIKTKAIAEAAETKDQATAQADALLKRAEDEASRTSAEVKKLRQEKDALEAALVPLRKEKADIDKHLKAVAKRLAMPNSEAPA